MKSFCRICLQTKKECENINGLNIYFNEELHSVKVILEEFSELLITDIIDVPLTICLSCINELTQTYSFLKKIRKGEEYLRNIINSLNINKVNEIETSNSIDSNNLEEYIKNENYDDNFANLIDKFVLPDSDCVYFEEENREESLTSKTYQLDKDEHSLKNDFQTFEEYVNEIIIEEPINDDEQNDIYCLPHGIESDEYNLEVLNENQNKEKIESHSNAAAANSDRSMLFKNETVQINDNCSSNDYFDISGDNCSPLSLNSNKSLKKKFPEISENNSMDIVKNPITADYDTLAANNVFACNFCPQAFSTESFLNHHMKILHKCSYCDKIFSKTLDLYEHGKIEHRTFKCKICFKNYSSSSNYKSHLKKIHNVLNFI